MKTYLVRLRDVAIHPQALAIFLAIFTIFFIFYGAIQTALPLLLSDEFALLSGEIGLILAMVTIASATVSSQYGRISQWRTAPELIALGFIANGISLLGVWVASSPLLIGVSLLAFGVGFGIAMPSIDATIVTLVSNRLRAGMMGMRTSMLRLGQTLGPISFTYFAETTFASTIRGYRLLLLISGMMILISGLIVYPLLRR